MKFHPHFRNRRPLLDASLSTSVALYLIILAFLVLMFSVSDVKLSKVGAVLHSISEAFDGDTSERESDKVEDPADEMETITGGAQLFIRESAALVSSAIELESMRVGSQGSLLAVEISSARAFIGASDIVRPELENFLSEMKLLIEQAGADERREIEFVFGRSPWADEAGSAQDLNQLALRRADALARKLIELGIERQNIAVGVSDGPANRVTIAFLSRGLDGARVNFDQ